MNRKGPKGWLTPTTRHGVQTHLNMVDRVCSILPVTDWTLEVNRVAFMRMEDGSVKGIDFRNGTLKGCGGAKEYVSAQQEGRCALCGHPTDHHPVPRSEGGSDGPENIVSVCADCHAKIHRGKDEQLAKALMEMGEKKKRAALSILSEAIPYILDGLIERFGENTSASAWGVQTATARNAAGAEKPQAKDAAIIVSMATGVVLQILWKEPFRVKQFHRHEGALVKAQTERTYRLDEQVVAKNRMPRWELRLSQGMRPGLKQRLRTS